MYAILVLEFVGCIILSALLLGKIHHAVLDSITTQHLECMMT
jgi:hypothetical protein